jgi:hypothetical protein
MGEFLGQRPWRSMQPHSRLAQEPVALATIASPAGDDLILPAVGGAAAGGGHHVVNRELRRRHRLVAVLAGAVIPEQEVAPVGSQHPPRDLNIGEEADDDHVIAKAPPSHRLLDCLARLIVNESDALLGKQNDKPPLTDDIQRLK